MKGGTSLKRETGCTISKSWMCHVSCMCGPLPPCMKHQLRRGFPFACKAILRMPSACARHFWGPHTLQSPRTAGQTSRRGQPPVKKSELCAYVSKPVFALHRKGDLFPIHPPPANLRRCSCSPLDKVPATVPIFLDVSAPTLPPFLSP